MLELLNEWFASFTVFAKSNPVVSGIVSLWGLGVITFIFKKIPGQLWHMFVKQFTVRVVINGGDEAFINLMKWYQETGKSNNSRTLRLTNGKGESKEILSAGYGNHYFWFNNLPFKLVRKKEEGGTTEKVRESIELITIGRSQDKLKRILEASNPFFDSTKMTKVYRWEHNLFWSLSHDQLVRSLDTVILPHKIKVNLVNHLKVFKADRDWYESHGIPYRTGLCLYGPPGTGKTSLVRSICGLDSRDLYILNLGCMTDEHLEEAMVSIKENAVVLIEDIDSFKAANKRITDDKVGIDTSLTLSGILNAIDGVSGSNGRIIIITTNKLDAIDPALLRPGRVDLKLELGYLTKETAISAFISFFPEYKIPKFRLREKLTPAEFQSIVMQFKDKPKDVLDLISLHDS